MIFQWYNMKFYCLGSIYGKYVHKLTTNDGRDYNFTALTVNLD